MDTRAIQLCVVDDLILTRLSMGTYRSLTEHSPKIVLTTEMSISTVAQCICVLLLSRASSSSLRVQISRGNSETSTGQPSRHLSVKSV